MLRGHILVVDDSTSLRAALRTALEGLGFSVTEAPSGRVALDHARSQFPDAVLVDLDMPVQDGWQLVQVLRRDFRTSDLPTLGMTARGDVSRAEAERFGLSTVLRKPFTRADLFHAISRLTQRHEEPPDEDALLQPQQIPRVA